MAPGERTRRFWPLLLALPGLGWTPAPLARRWQESAADPAGCGICLKRALVTGPLFSFFFLGGVDLSKGDLSGGGADVEAFLSGFSVFQVLFVGWRAWLLESKFVLWRRMACGAIRVPASSAPRI